MGIYVIMQLYKLESTWQVLLWRMMLVSRNVCDLKSSGRRQLNIGLPVIPVVTPIFLRLTLYWVDSKTCCLGVPCGY